MPSPRSSRPFSFLAPLATLIWPLFLVCSGLVAVVWLTGFGAGVVETGAFDSTLSNRELRTALVAISRALDSIWITLGAVHLYLVMARAEGLEVARRWGGLTFAAGLAVAYLAAGIGVPNHILYFPTNLGLKLGVVPFAIPLLWIFLVFGARETVLRLFPRMPHAGTAVVTGLLCTLTAAVLNPVAWKYRAWWLWYPGQTDAPAQTPWGYYLVCLLVAGTLAYFMRSPHIVPRLKKRPHSPIIAYAILTALAALTALSKV